MPVIEKTEFVSKDDERRPFLYECDKPGCYYRVGCKTREEAEAQNEHLCPRKGPTRNNMTLGAKDSYERTWDELDNTITEIMTSPDKESVEKAKQYALGLAYALSRYCHYQLTTVDAIRREALRRYKMRIGEIESFPTQGYVHDKPIPLLSQEEREKLRAEVAETVKRSAEGVKSSRKPALTQQQEMAIKSGLAGGFSPQELAKLYNVPEAAVVALQ